MIRPQAIVALLKALAPAALVGAACAASGEASRATTTMKATTKLAEHMGQRITVHGVARDAKLGAVIVLDSGAVVYVAGRESWSDAEVGHRVALTGILRERKLAPDPVVGPGGAMSTGMVGSAYVLTEPCDLVVTP